MGERVKHVNRIKGLLFAQGIFGYEPLRKRRREGLEALQTGDGRPLPACLKAQIVRELDRLEVVLAQLKAVEAERDALLEPATDAVALPAAMLARLKGIGPETAAVLWSEGLFRHFDNRRQLAAYAGLAPTPWRCGSIDHEQGVSKAGNPRLRTARVELAWLWLQNQPTSALSLWFHQRVQRLSGRVRKTAIVALARKRLVALSRYTSAGVGLEGAVMRAESLTPHPRGPDQARRIQAAEPKRPMASTAEGKNGPGLLSPRPPDAGCWCRRHERRPYVSLIWCARHQVTEAGSDLDPNQPSEHCHEPLNRTLDPEHAHVSGRLRSGTEPVGLARSRR